MTVAAVIEPIFSGHREGAYSFVTKQPEGYYVYVLCRPDGRPFYIGKGKGNRLIQHELEALRDHPIGESNPFKCNVIRKIRREGADILYQIDSWYPLDSEQACLVSNRPVNPPLSLPTTSPDFRARCGR